MDTGPSAATCALYLLGCEHSVGFLSVGSFFLSIGVSLWMPLRLGAGWILSPVCRSPFSPFLMARLKGTVANSLLFAPVPYSEYIRNATDSIVASFQVASVLRWVRVDSLFQALFRAPHSFEFPPFPPMLLHDFSFFPSYAVAIFSIPYGETERDCRE